MSDHTGYVRARIKTYEQLVKVYREARHRGKPISLDHLFLSADEIIIPYLGKTVWVKKIQVDLCSFYYEIQDSEGLIVMPDWIDYFDTAELVPPSEWTDPYEDRAIFPDDLIIITG